MIVSIKMGTPEIEIKQVKDEIESRGFEIHDITGENYYDIVIVGDTSKLDEGIIKAHKCVVNVIRVQAPYQKVNRLYHPEDTIVEVDGVKIGGNNNLVMIGGPCSVESEEQILTIAKEVKAAGAKLLRGGAYKPRTSPYSFQGIGHEGILALKAAKEKYGLPIVSELMSTDNLDEFIEHVDIIQIGARNMHNYDLLKAVGRTKKPVLLKRGMSATIEEWLMSAEYIMNEGNENIILCERGIRTFEKYTRNTLDLSVIPIVKNRTHLPIIIDPSHAVGKWELIESMSLAAIAAGCDGLLIEVHHDPENALSDGAQSLKPEKYKQLIQKGKEIAKVIGRDI